MRAKTANAPWVSLAQAPRPGGAPADLSATGLARLGFPRFCPRRAPDWRALSLAPTALSALREAPAKDANQSPSRRPSVPSQSPSQSSAATSASDRPHAQECGPARVHDRRAPGGRGRFLPPNHGLSTVPQHARPLLLLCRFACQRAFQRHMWRFARPHPRRPRALPPPPRAPGLKGPSQPADGACPIFCVLADSRGHSVQCCRIRLARFFGALGVSSRRVMPCLFPATRCPHSRVCRFISAMHGIMQRHSPHIPATAHGNSSPLVPGQGQGTLHPGWVSTVENGSCFSYTRSAPEPGQSVAQRLQRLPRRDEGLLASLAAASSSRSRAQSWDQSALLSMGAQNACKMPIIGPLPPARRLLPVTGWRRLPNHCSHSLSPLDRLAGQQPTRCRSDAPSGVTLVVPGTPSLGRENGRVHFLR